MSSGLGQNKIAGIRSALVKAIKGTQQDYTAMALNRAIFLLAVPMVLEMVMESVFALVDVYFVSRLGAEAVATVGLTESILTLIYAVASGLAMATAATVARRIGEKDYSRASSAAVQSIIIAFTVGLIIAIPLSFNEQGVYYAIVVADTCMTLAGVYLFRKGKWRLKQV